MVTFRERLNKSIQDAKLRRSQSVAAAKIRKDKGRAAFLKSREEQEIKFQKRRAQVISQRRIERLEGKRDIFGRLVRQQTIPKQVVRTRRKKGKKGRKTTRTRVRTPIVRSLAREQRPASIRDFSSTPGRGSGVF